MSIRISHLASEKIEATLQECIISLTTLLTWFISIISRHYGSTAYIYCNKSNFSCISLYTKIFRTVLLLLINVL